MSTYPKGALKSAQVHSELRTRSSGADSTRELIAKQSLIAYEQIANKEAKTEVIARIYLQRSYREKDAMKGANELST